MLFERYPVLIRGAGEQASAIAWHLRRAGFPLAMTELPGPLTVRRQVSFSQAARSGHCSVQGVGARLCGELPQPDKHGDTGAKPAPAVTARVASRVKEVWRAGEIALVIDAGLSLLEHIDFFALVDARMTKSAGDKIAGRVPFTLAIGPAISAGEQVDVIVETKRGHELGRIIVRGQAARNTGVPGEIGGETLNRVCHSPCGGRFCARARIGDLVSKGDLLGVLESEGEEPREIVAKIAGRVRGLLADGETVPAGAKLADIDPRGEAIDPATISDKGRTIAAGVLTALLEALGERTGAVLP